MAISFQCPQCQKAFKVKDELAGKKVACTQCKNIMVVPRPDDTPANAEALEAMATAALAGEERAALSNGSATHPVATVEGAIPLECPFCFETVEFSATQAGRKAPCPLCRRIVTVPAPKTEKPKDWRSVDERPTLARTDTGPAPEGAWGNTKGLGGVVSREALLEAEVIVDRKTLAAPKRGVLFSTLGILACLAMGIGWSMRGKQMAGDERAALMKSATDAADVKPDDAKALPPGWSSVNYRAAGTFQLREPNPDLKKAAQYFQAARNATRRLDSIPDRAGLLLDVLLAQADLVGDDAKVTARTALPRDEAHRELRQTLQSFRDLPRDHAWLAIECLTRKLKSFGAKDPMVAALAPEAIGGDGSRSEALAVVALMFMALGEPGDKIAADVQSAAAGSTSPRVAALLIARKQLAEARAILPEATVSDWKLPSRLAWAEGHARGGDLDRAIKIVLDPGSPEDQSAAAAMVADALVDAKAIDRLPEMTALIIKHGEKFRLADWVWDRTSRACRRAGRADLVRALADGCKQPSIKPWLELEALRAELDAPMTPASPEMAERIGEKTVPQAIAWLLVGRHIAATGKADPRPVIEAWTQPAARALGMAGAALGLQDKRSK